MHKKLKDQYTRSRIMLEQAMEDCTRFEESELRKLMQNPVIWPLLKHLVFICNGQTGFYTDGLLVTAKRRLPPVKSERRVTHRPPHRLVCKRQLARISEIPVR